MPTIHDVLAAARVNVRPDSGVQKVIATPKRVAAAPPVVDVTKLAPIDRHLRAVARAEPGALAKFKTAINRSSTLRAAVMARIARTTDAVTQQSSIDARVKKILLSALE